MIRTEVDIYVAQRRAVGYKFKIQNSLLTNFARFADQRHEQYLRNSTMLDWAGQAPSPAQKRNRLLTVRRFAVWLNAGNSLHQVPPVKAFGHYISRRRKPYIYSESEVKALLHAASQLTPVSSVRSLTFTTLITLLYVSGLRISEALSLSIADITDDGLLIRSTKFNKDRLVPIHTSTRAALDSYISSHYRKSIVNDDAIFVSLHGSRLAYSTALSTFLTLLRKTGLSDGPGKPGPRFHDLRHTFAVRSLERCPANAQAIKQHTVSLSAYLGHAHVTDTYWYLEATPVLARQIATNTESWFLERIS